MEGLAGVKAVIKSMVLSYNDALTVEKLSRLYKSEEGEYIPHRKFGFNNLESFLNSMPDAVIIIGYGPQALVRPVSSEKTKHLEEMISRQKKKPLPKRSNNRNGSALRARFGSQSNSSSHPQINIYNQHSHYKGHGYVVNGFQYQNQVNPVAMQNLQFAYNNMWAGQYLAAYNPYFQQQHQQQPYKINNLNRCAGNIPTQVLRNYNQNANRQQYSSYRNPFNFNNPPPYGTLNQHISGQTTQKPVLTPQIQESRVVFEKSLEAQEEVPQPRKDNLSSYLQPDFVRPSDEELTKILKSMLINPKVPKETTQEEDPIIKETVQQEDPIKEPEPVRMIPAGLEEEDTDPEQTLMPTDADEILSSDLAFESPEETEFEKYSQQAPQTEFEGEPQPVQTSESTEYDKEEPPQTFETDFEEEFQQTQTEYEEEPPQTFESEFGDEPPQLVKSDSLAEEDDFMSIDGSSKSNLYFSKRTDEEEDVYGSATSLLSVCSTTSVSSRSQRHCHRIMRILEKIEDEKVKSSPPITRANLMKVETVSPPSSETVAKLSQNNILRDNIVAQPKVQRTRCFEMAEQQITALNNKSVRFAENKQEIKKIQKISKIRSLRKEIVDLTSISEEKKKSEDEEIDEELALPPTLDMDFLCNMDIPDNVMKAGHKLRYPVFPESLKVGKYVPIFVTEVNSPFKFWFHVRKDEDDLDLMMNTMDTYFRELPYDNLRMKKSHMVKGQIAAVLYTTGRVWHRAEILQKYENDVVKVFFVDYGTIDYVEWKNIKYLPIEFSLLPKQAFRGSLSHIKPVKRRWTSDAVCDFISMVTDLLLYAKIESIEPETNSCHISLVNTINKDDIYINKEMIVKGHALHDNNWDNPNLTVKQKMHWTDVFPSFEMYETGNYPTYTELGIWLANNYDFERKNDNKFTYGVDGDYSVFTNQLNFMFQ